MHSWLIGLVCLSLLGNLIPIIETTPIGSSLGLSKNERRAEFGESIGNWFRNMKNRIFGGPNNRDVLPPVEAEKMMMDLENDDIEERRRKDPDGFFLDISNLTFDPQTDWGFRLGNWYFIRKSHVKNVINCNTYRPTFPDWTMSKEDSDDNTVPSLTTTRAYKDVTITEVLTVKDATPEVSSGTIIPVGKNEDNETGSPNGGDRSTEVLAPPG